MLRPLAVFVLIAGLLPARAWSYAFIGYSWSTTPVTLHLQLGSSGTPLLDGTASWGASVEAAMADWNAKMRDVRFAAVRDSTAAKAEGNSINNIFFATEIYGSPFGSGVLAVTLMYSNGAARFTETDVIYNNRLNWNAYRGPQRTTSTAAPMYDFYRVTLHELGHVLGLDHPDTAGQSVVAVMNSRVSSTDALMTDDIDGARALYGAPGGMASPPVILTQPVSRSVTTGQTVSFSVTASNATTATYQWTKSGSAIFGATAATYTIAGAALSDAGNYAVIITNSSGSVTSATATLTVTAPAPPPSPPPPPPAVAPTILVQPVASHTVSRGASVTFSATVAGTAPLSQQWLHYSTPIPGATSSSFTLVNVQPSDAGVYYLRVANSAGSVASNVARLEVRVAPTITAEPADRTVNRGAAVTFIASATGTPEPSFQWQKNGVPLSGATSATLVFNAAQPSDAGSYAAVATNSEGAVTSRSATLVVHSPPVLTTQPVAQTVIAGAPASFTVAAGGNPTPTYQWLKDGTAIPGATSTALSLAAAQAGDAGVYTVVVTNSVGSAVSSGAALVVHTPPVITHQPASQTVAAGMPVMFTATANAIPAPTYQWRKDGVDIGGATGPTLSLSSVQPANAGTYTVVVRNSVGGVASTPAALGVHFSRLLNLSTRGYVPPGGSLTPGFVVRGAGSKALVIRAIGPSLKIFGVSDALTTPQLAVLAAGATTPAIANGGWSGTAELRDAFASVGAFPLMAGSGDAATKASLAPNAYSVRVTASDPDDSGVALAELYDAAEPSTATRIINASTLGFADVGERTLTPGFVISGNVPKRLLIRVVGPSLEQFGVPQVLADPRLQILPLGQATVVAANDNWGGTPELKNAFAQVGAFTLADPSLDAAVAVTLAPGAYSVLIAGPGGAVGHVLIELYDLDL